MRIFRDHLKFILQSNIERFRTYRLELNEFADWTIDEFNNWKKGLVFAENVRRHVHIDIDEEQDRTALQRSLRKLYRKFFYSNRIRRLKQKRFFRDWFHNLFHWNKKPTPGSDIFDWRTKNVVSSVKNQAKCGCCYAFSTASILETLYALKRNSTEIIEFSPQQLTDCSADGNNGCQGGNFGPSVRYILGRGGKIATAKSYPYVGKRQTCRDNGFDEIHLGRIEYQPLPEGDEKRMEEALINHGPLFIGVDAETQRFMFYRSGILNIDGCPKQRRDMDHAMVIVGYGHDPALKKSYWNIRNSWGTKWGENGYVRLAKDQDNMCGVASMAYYAKLV